MVVRDVLGVERNSAQPFVSRLKLRMKGRERRMTTAKQEARRAPRGRRDHHFPAWLTFRVITLNFKKSPLGEGIDAYSRDPSVVDQTTRSALSPVHRDAQVPETILELSGSN